MVERIRITDAIKLASSPLPEPPLLTTESSEDFNRIFVALNKEIRPHGIIEEMYVSDIAHHTCDIVRGHRWKAAIINSEIGPALASLISRLEFGGLSHQAAILAKNWYTDPAAKKKVAELLRKFGLDESAIEAQAFQRSALDLAVLDRMIASSESRRSKALRNIAECDFIFAERLGASSERIIGGKAPEVKHRVGEMPPTAA
jgi:hypothetical protein